MKPTIKSIKLRPEADFIISIDDYHPFNYEIAELIKKYGFSAIFFIDLKNAEAAPQIKALSDMGFKIGSHTITHPPDLKILSDDLLDYEIKISKWMIEDITGKPCTIFCYPKGKHNDRVIEAVKYSGYKCARTTHVLRTDCDDLFRTPTTIHMYPRKEYGGESWYDMAIQFLDNILDNGGIFHLWGHAFELEKFGYWDLFEKFLGEVKKNKLQAN